MTAAKTETGRYKVTFPRAVNNCAYNATNAAEDNVIADPNEIAVAKAIGVTNAVSVSTANDGGTLIDDQFMVMVTC